MDWGRVFKANVITQLICLSSLKSLGLISLEWQAFKNLPNYHEIHCIRRQSFCITNVFIVIFFTQLEKRWEKRNKVCKVSACEGRRRVFSACERKRRVFSACERKRRVFSACERKRRVFSACERKRLFSSSFPARVGKCWIFQIITLSSFSTRGVQT